ncbi:MAG: KH domain-containing protein [Fimbriimonadaceae bacterium]|nr:KH domain-containing protein [Fimbriimonadaceae bacterium]QYK54881.1 MAG: KH domain-containing protein [Fimbriimonadaceae bacterium]
MSLSDFVQRLVELTVLEPDSVSVQQSADRGATIYLVSVAPNDVGRVIGKDGRVITCIRQLVSAAGAKAKQRTVVKVVTE